MTTIEAMSLLKEAHPELKPIINGMATKKVSADDFDPAKHVDFKAPSKIHTMSDLKLPEGTGVSPVAVSEPFHLFTEETVQRMRAEIFSKNVWENCQYSSNLAQCQLRGFAAKYVLIFQHLVFGMTDKAFKICTFCLRCLETSRNACDHLKDCWRGAGNRNGF